MELIDDYLGAIGRRYTTGTLKAYSWALRDWERFLEEHGSPEPSSWCPKHIELWQEEQWERKLSPRSRQLASTALRTMLKWAARHDRDVRSDLYLTVDSVSAPRLLPRPIPPRDLDRLLAYFGRVRPRAAEAWWRDRALFLYLISTSARVSEALQLTVDEFTAAAVVIQKGGDQKVLLAGDTALQAVLDYLMRRNDNHPALWVTAGGGGKVRALTPEGVREIWIRLSQQLEIARFTTHQVRHTTATEMLDAGVAPEVIAHHMGHSGLSSLAGYAELRMGRRREAVDAIDKRIRTGMGPASGRGIVAIRSGRRRRKSA